MKEAVIVSTARTGIGKAYKGAFNNTNAPTLGGWAIEAAVKRAGIDPAEVDDVIIGCGLGQGTAGPNIVRLAALAGGLPVTVSGMTIDRQCSSGMMAIATAALIIAPWNYSFLLAVKPLVAAIAAGNTAIIKPSEMAPHVSAFLKKMIDELYKEKEVAVFGGDAKVATELLKLPFNHLFFTGSPRVGKITMKAAAENLASTTLELGGKSPAIIDKSAKISDGSGSIVWGKFMNSGQTCIAPDYVLVKTFSNERAVVEQKSLGFRPLFPPYDKRVTDVLEQLLSQ